jgi:hypothetical protein
MVRMVKKVSALNTLNIQTYFDEHNELNVHNDPNYLLEYLHGAFSAI